MVRRALSKGCAAVGALGVLAAGCGGTGMAEQVAAASPVRLEGPTPSSGWGAASTASMSGRSG
ncbi:hypothetical protein ACFQU9_38770 [Actinomadura namibiensis]|uniref:Uncharacterized protein n=1 Tax=Actinomadura namibiensis TaxID=182080 RepID=A0A7W3LLA4_ACTNM|nr:hypothetical protein [Actinomadura namibiensis]MBA8950147.1 hypothetical protein [Actinomadura namibiensis]